MTLSWVVSSYCRCIYIYIYIPYFSTMTRMRDANSEGCVRHTFRRGERIAKMLTRLKRLHVQWKSRSPRYTFRNMWEIHVQKKHDRTSVTHKKWNDMLSFGCVWHEVIVSVDKIKHHREKDLHGRFIFHQDQLIVKSWQVKWPSDAEVDEKYIGYIVLELFRLIVVVCPLLFTSVSRQYRV